MPRLYLDVCCLNRPFDDQAQPRVRLEAEAVLLILDRCADGDWHWIGSDAIGLEIGRTPDPERRMRVAELAAGSAESVPLDTSVLARASQLGARGFGVFDASHLSCAEADNAEVFLTTDDRLIRVARRQLSELRVRVANPLTWMEEVTT